MKSPWFGFVAASACVFALAGTSNAFAADPLALKRGDHIAIVGNTLADRMQRDGWFEAYLYSAHPEFDLVVRHLGFSGDELTTRLRSANFGSPDDWLAKVKADVVLAFFGYNESFGGEAGLPKFKQDLDEFLSHTLAQKYNGKSAPRVVLFGPIAHEAPKGRDLPNPDQNNRRLRIYSDAMAEVCKLREVPFVDLFSATLSAFEKGGESTPLTINGIHLNERGDRALADMIERFAYPSASKPRTESALQKLRQAILDKNEMWYQRYRTVDGYSIYGGRADLAFVGGQTNRVVMQREMEVLDVMTANRDKRIWAVAKGGDLAVDDGNTPPFIPVETNKPGPLPGGKHVFLDGEEAIGKMTVAANMKVNLFASEKQFPDLVNPVQMSWDPAGRLWVAVWPTYPHWKPKEPRNDKLLVFEDTNGDGKADKQTTFADGLHCPTGFELVPGGALVAQAPELWKLEDTDGDGKADKKTRVIHGLDSADTHHTSNSFVIDPGGAVYFQEGTFHHSQVETPYGPPVRLANAGVFRYEPKSQRFEVYVTYPFANPHGHAFDRWGQDIVVDGTGANPYHGALFSGYLPFPQKHAGPPQVYQQRTRPCPGIEFLSSRHFPPEHQGRLLVANVIGFQGILQYQVLDDGSSFGATEVEPLLSSTDPNFRPSDLKVGPDGAIYFIDWHNPIIGHMQHNLRDPSRDREHGRIYRVTYQGRELLKPAKIAGEPIARLLDLLLEPDDRVRYRTRIELRGRNANEVLPALTAWLAKLDPNDPNVEHHRLEALWMHQSHDVVNRELLDQALRSPEFRVRAAAVRVLNAWRDRIPDALERLKVLAADEHPRVRLEAIRAASFQMVPEAIEVPLIAAAHPSDRFIEFVRGETMKALDPLVKQALADRRPIKFTTPAGSKYILGSIATDQLLSMGRGADVCRELLRRPGVRDEFRKEAVAALAKELKRPEAAVLLDALREQDTAADASEGVPFDLARQLTELPVQQLGDAPILKQIGELAANAKSPLVRQIGFLVWVDLAARAPAPAGDSTAVEQVWSAAVKKPRTLQDLVAALPMVRDAAARAVLYPKVEALLKRLPAELAASPNAKSTFGRYVRIELPGQSRTLTLAEVEVMSDGRNVARRGKASQKNTAHGGEASRAIDGNKGSSYGDGGQTHSAEGTNDPWWEVDLGADMPIDSVTIYNRGDGYLGRRLQGFALKVLDSARSVVFEKANNPAPDVKAEIAVGGASIDESVRRAAMLALASVRGREAAAFQAIAPFVASQTDRAAAVRALLRIPESHYPKDQVRPVIGALLKEIRELPAADRTSPTALDTQQLANSLAGLLPAAEAKAARKELGELGVQIIRIGTLTDQMLFDKERIVIRAGKPVEFVFENTDIMPHNLVVARPGSLEEIGNLGESTATQPGAAERGYVPQSPKIMLASRLLQPRESQRMSFTAPSQSGVYPYLCTYPGHWRRMFGSLYVVEDLDEYQSDPETYLSSHPMPIADELLKFNRPRTEWKLADLAPSVEHLSARSYSTGKQMFQVASCISCHKLEGTGQQLGADLSKIDPKLTNAEILRHILEPSFEINQQYQTHVFALKSGKTISGLVVGETPEAFKVVENPLVKAEATPILRADVEEHTKSPTSMMPKGLLDKLTREEILDLLAYVVAKGDAKNPAFQGGHEHGHK